MTHRDLAHDLALRERHPLVDVARLVGQRSGPLLESLRFERCGASGELASELRAHIEVHGEILARSVAL